MIRAEDLRRQAANKYPSVVKSLLRGESPFPLFLRYKRIRNTAPREEILKDLATLRAEAERGLTIEWRTIDTVRYGTNDLPGDISIATEADYFGYIGKAEEVRAILEAASVLTKAIPTLSPEIPVHWRILREGDTTLWENICRVLIFFRDNPFPNCYARELPIAVPTKFIQDKKSVIEPLLKVVAPESINTDGASFEERIGLKTPDSLIECRYLDDHLHPEWKFRQFTIPLCDLHHLSDVPATTVFITENRTNFLTLPSLPDAIALQGQGYAVSRLRSAEFLKHRSLLYWGDLDVQGFEILAVLRRFFPNVKSFLMDKITWNDHSSYRQPGVRSKNCPDQYLPYLNAEESELFKIISETDERLEQEKISQAYVDSKLNDLFTG